MPNQNLTRRLTNSKSQYGWIHISLHWLTAIVVFGLFTVGWWMVDLSYYDNWYHTAPSWHKAIGLLLAGVISLRLLWKYLNHRPLELANSPLEKLAARLAHGLLYSLLISLFITGYLISTAKGAGIDIFGWFTVPALFNELPATWVDFIGDMHWYIAVSLMLLVSIHTAAACKHHFVDRDDTLKRMFGILSKS